MFIVFVCNAIVDAFCMCVMQPMHSVGGNVGRSRGRRPLVRALSPCGVLWICVELAVCGCQLDETQRETYVSHTSHTQRHAFACQLDMI